MLVLLVKVIFTANMRDVHQHVDLTGTPPTLPPRLLQRVYKACVVGYMMHQVPTTLEEECPHAIALVMVRHQKRPCRYCSNLKPIGCTKGAGYACVQCVSSIGYQSLWKGELLS